MDNVLDTLPQLYSKNAQRVREDLQNLLARIPSLKAKENTFVSNEGNSYLLVSLVGTIPIWFRSTQYNIPVEVFVVREYPESPPICFVRPTRGMEIRPRHKHVDSSGQCYSPYIFSWNHQRSNLLGLITDLQVAFSANPPVHSKPSSSASEGGIQSSSTSSFPPPVYSPQQPVPPVYSPQQPVPPVYSPQQPVPPVYSPPHSDTSVSSQPQRPPVYQPYMMPPSPASQLEGGKWELENRMLRRASQVWQTLSADMAQFQLIRERLTNGTLWLQHSLTTLSQDKRELEDLLRVAAEKEDEVSKWVAESETVQVDVDDLVIPSDVLSAQMMDLVAEDSGIEDVLYYLNKALHANKLDIETHLKMTRNLCREQFQKRALAQRVYEMQSQSQH